VGKHRIRKHTCSLVTSFPSRVNQRHKSGECLRSGNDIVEGSVLLGYSTESESKQNPMFRNSPMPPSSSRKSCCSLIRKMKRIPSARLISDYTRRCVLSKKDGMFSDTTYFYKYEGESRENIKLHASSRAAIFTLLLRRRVAFLLRTAT